MVQELISALKLEEKLNIWNFPFIDPFYVKNGNRLVTYNAVHFSERDFPKQFITKYPI